MVRTSDLSEAPETTTEAFVTHAAAPLRLRHLAGPDKSRRKILSSRIQKPGLALAGYTDFVRPSRIQIFGETEITYLATLEARTQEAVLQNFVSMRPCAIILTKGLAAPAPLARLADGAHTPLYQTPIRSSEAIRVIAQYLEDLLAPQRSIHGVLLDVDGVGVLISGASGIGKSECALDLVSRGHRLVADDIVEIRRRGDDLVGQASAIVRHLIEIRGLGILNVAELYGVASTRDRKRIELHVELQSWDQNPDRDRAMLEDQTQTFLGVGIPSLHVPVRPGRNIGGIVEVAARNFLLQLRGHHAGRDLNRRIQAHLEGSEIPSTPPALKDAAQLEYPAEHIEDEIE